MRLFFFSLVSLAWLLTGCVSTMNNYATQSWLGHSQRELIAAWGTPEREYSDGRGGQVLIYYHISGYISPGSLIAETSDKFIVEQSQTSRITHRQLLYVDPAGKIYLWRRQQ